MTTTTHATPSTSRKTQVFVMPFSHLDLLWLGNREECVNRGCLVFQEAIRLCEQDPDFCFMIEDGVFLEQFIRLRPNWKDRLVTLMRDGRIEPPAKWCTITQTNVHGEVLARNLLYGLRYTRELCDQSPRCLHLGDLPAHPASLPQIMNAAGLDALVISRGGPMTQPLFRWRGAGGAEVVCWHAPYCYNWGLPLGEPPARFAQDHEAKLAEEAAVMAEPSAGRVFMHYGWDLSVPTAHALENLRRWNEGHETKLCWATQEAYFKGVRDEPGLPGFEGEMPTVWGNWPDPAYLDVTVHHDAAQSALLLAERLCAFGLIRGDPPSATTLERHWKLLLESLDHNYSAVATEETHERKNRLTQGVLEAAQRHAAHHLSLIAAAVPRRGDDVPVVVFNPSSFARSEVTRGRVILYGHAEALTPEGRKSFHLVDAEGRSVPFDIVEHRVSAADQVEVAIASHEVPPLGHTTYYVRYGEAPRDVPVDSGACIEAALSLETDPLSGEVSIKDASGHPLMSIFMRAVEQDPKNQIMQLTETGRVFPFLVASHETLVRNALRSECRVRGTIGHAPVSLGLRLDHVAGTLDIDATIDHDGQGYLRYQLLFTPSGGVEADSLVIGNPFGSNRFTALVPGCAPAREDEVTAESYGRTREAQGWFLMKGRTAECALAVATTRRLIECREDGVAVNLLSSMSAKWIKPAQVFHPFAGRYSSRFRVKPVTPGDRTAAARLAETLWQPMPITCDYSGGGVAECASRAPGLLLSPGNVHLSAMKIADDGDGVIVRLVETAGRACAADVCVAGLEGEVFETSLVETRRKPLNARAIAMHPFEIKTLRFTGPRVRVDRSE